MNSKVITPRPSRAELYARGGPVMSEDPYRLSVDILEDDDDGDQIGLRLIAELPPNYPNEPPELEMSIVRKISRDQLAACLEHVRGLVEENLGMPMVFTLAGAATEWLQENVVGQPDKTEEYERGKQSFETFSDQVIYDVTEAAASRGTPVTPGDRMHAYTQTGADTACSAESFAIWKEAFDKEMGVKVKVAVTTGTRPVCCNSSS